MADSLLADPLFALAETLAAAKAHTNAKVENLRKPWSLAIPQSIETARLDPPRSSFLGTKGHRAGNNAKEGESR